MIEQLVSLSDSASTASASGNGMTVLESLGLGGSVMILGLAIVFFGLVSLIFITWLYPKFVNAVFPKVAAAKARKAVKKAERLLEKQQKKELKVIQVSETKKAETKAAVSAPVTNVTDPALIAVITAAIAASLGRSTNGIVIKSLRRSRPSLPAWGTSARIEQISNRL